MASALQSEASDPGLNPGRQDTFLSQYLSPPRGINEYRQI